MAFVDIAETPEREAMVEDLQRATTKPDYTINPCQIFENMDSDPQIVDFQQTDAPASRSELIAILETNDPTDIQERLLQVRVFCHAHTQEGDVDEIAGIATLGSVQELRVLAERLYAMGGWTLDQVLASVRKLVRIRDPQKRLRLQQNRFDSVKLSQYQKWSFYDNQYPDEPLDALGDSREAHVVRLGLGQYDSNSAVELIRWTHRLPSGLDARRPTAWDADVGDSSVYWRPGGKTHPTRTGFGHGLSEVVHEPITAQEFVTGAEPLEI